MRRSTSYGTPALKVGTRGLLARLREDGATLVVRVDPDERARLLEDRPDAFFLTPHYERAPFVLVRLEAADTDEIADLLIDAWRALAPRRALAAYDVRPSDLARSPLPPPTLRT